jgi:predicted nicotinamide N-methyase
MKKNNVQCETRAHGVTLLHGNHKKIVPLKKSYTPTEHGHKVWPTSWLLIDYLEKTRLVSDKRVMDLGCGWGLSGIYCAKEQGAQVICVDIDAAVEPYVNVMAKVNKVQVQYCNLGIEHIPRSLLHNVDVIIASDICFCDSLIDPLRRLIQRAKKACVEHILISDPGRWPFDDLCELFARKKGVELIAWQTEEPSSVNGTILSIQLS